MPISERTNWPSEPNPLTRAVEARRAAGAEIIDLTESNPTRCGFGYPVGIFQALSNPLSAFYEPDPQGLLSAREAVAGHYKSLNRSFDPADFFLTSGTSESYALLFKLLCDAGGEILAPVPSYPLIEHIARISDVGVRPYFLRYNDGWQIDFESLSSAVSEATRAIVVISPHNPTGHVVDGSSFQRIVSLAEDLNAAVIVDEVFSGYDLKPNAADTEVQPGATPEISRSAISAPSPRPERPVPIVYLNGLSKLAGLPQLKLGWIAVESYGEQKDAFTHSLQMLCDTFLSVNTPVQQAAADILRFGNFVNRRIHDRVRRNYASLRELTGSGSPVTTLEADAGWSAMLRLPAIMSDEEWALAMLEHGVLVRPGHFFDSEDGDADGSGPEVLVAVSLLPREEAFDRGVKLALACVRERC